MTQEIQNREAGARLGWIEELRILAAFAVVVIHVCSKDFRVPATTSSVWQWLNVYESLVRWPVPVFMMISGALLLDPGRDMPPKKLFSRHFPRILTALVFWSLLYAGLYTGLYLHGSLQDVLRAAYEGHAHLWYLYALLGLYLVTPLLRPIAASRTASRYFVLLAAVFAVLLPTLENLDALPVLRYFADKLKVGTVLGYSGYYMLGWVLRRESLSRRARGVLYALGALGFAVTALVCGWGSWTRGSVYIPLYEYDSVCSALEAAAVFVFAKEHLGRLISRPWVRELSRCTFGIYLMHVIPIDLLRRFCGLSTMTVHPALSVPLIALLCFALSAAVTALLRRIPLVREYLV